MFELNRYKKIPDNFLLFLLKFALRLKNNKSRRYLHIRNKWRAASDYTGAEKFQMDVNPLFQWTFIVKEGISEYVKGPFMLQ